MADAIVCVDVHEAFSVELLDDHRHRVTLEEGASSAASAQAIHKHHTAVAAPTLEAITASKAAEVVAAIICATDAFISAFVAWPKAVIILLGLSILNRPIYCCLEPQMVAYSRLSQIGCLLDKRHPLDFSLDQQGY